MGDKEKKTANGGESREGEDYLEKIILNTHCQKCASKVKGKAKKCQGVENVEGDKANNRLTILGHFKASALLLHLEAESHQKLEIVSIQPSSKKASTVVIKIRMDCNGCIKRVKKTILRIIGVEELNVNAEEDLVTVVGVMNVDLLSSNLKKEVNRSVAIVSETTEGGSGEGVNGGVRIAASAEGSDGGGAILGGNGCAVAVGSGQKPKETECVCVGEKKEEAGGSGEKEKDERGADGEKEKEKGGGRGEVKEVGGQGGGGGVTRRNINALAGGKSNALAGGNSSALASGNSNALARGNSNALAGVKSNALAGGNSNALAGGISSALAGGNSSALAGGNSNALAGGSRSIGQRAGGGVVGGGGDKMNEEEEEEEGSDDEDEEEGSDGEKNKEKEGSGGGEKKDEAVASGEKKKAEVKKDGGGGGEEGRGNKEEAAKMLAKKTLAPPVVVDTNKMGLRRRLEPKKTP